MTLCWMTRWIVLNRHLVHIVWFTVGSTGLAIMMVINIFLLQRLIQTDFIKSSSSSSNGISNGTSNGSGKSQQIGTDIKPHTN